MAAADPLEALRLGPAPIAPRQEFAAALRSRIEAAVGHVTRGGRTMTTSEVGYITIETPDEERAQAFYGAVLGWEFAPGNVPHGYQITNVTPMGGLRGGMERSEVVLLFHVDDLEAAVARVRQAGGEVDEPRDNPYGRTAACRDDQGLRFDLLEPASRG